MSEKEKIESIQIICDGNRTYAILKGHIEDMGTYTYYNAWRKLENIVKIVIRDFNIKYSIYTITIRKNYLDQKRLESVKPVSSYLPRHYAVMKDFFENYKVKLKFIGDKRLFINSSENPKMTEDVIKNLERETSKNKEFFVFYQIAYDSIYEWVELFNKSRLNYDGANYNEYLKKLKIKYYGIDMPEIQVVIRTMRMRLSNALPIIIGEYADFYFYPGPFPLLNKKHLKLIIDDAIARLESKGGSFMYSHEDIESIRKFGFSDFDKKPLFIGKKVSRVWLPIQNSSPKKGHIKS